MKKKKLLSKKAGLDFNEIKDILSEETLSSFGLSEIKGGGGETVNELGAICFERNCNPQDGTCQGSGCRLCAC